MTKINISIPQPCHENWDAMTPEDKGRFCASCQKKVFDFTKASDREIVTAFQQNENLCGRFLSTQLDRDLIKPEKKNPIWLATTSAIISLVGLHEVAAQEKVPTEQTEKRVLLGKPAAPIKQGEVVANPEIEISGVVSDTNGPIPGVSILVKETAAYSTETDIEGKYKLLINKGDTLTFSFVGYKSVTATFIESNKDFNLQMKEEAIMLGETIYLKKRTFIGRLFHKSKYK